MWLRCGRRVWSCPAAPATVKPAAAPDLEALWEQQRGSRPLGRPGALQVATGFGLDIWVTDTFGGRANRVTLYATSR